MCRNITTLRGLEPPATPQEVEAAALQFVRKITGIRQPSAAVTERYDEAVQAITAISKALLVDLPPRKVPPPTLPPLRRLAAQGRPAVP